MPCDPWQQEPPSPLPYCAALYPLWVGAESVSPLEGFGLKLQVGRKPCVASFVGNKM